ncbi:MAG: hypothetical protein M1821_004790 [Bathelium mastoideum]|nr:MAG: hypothetical protein M1821_004790 [Bathelium mastoideum]
MSLYYPPLSKTQTRQIWETQIIRLREEFSPPIRCDQDELIEFAEKLYDSQSVNSNDIGPAWNGRQIRNAFQSAVALARYKASNKHDVEVTTEQFEKVARVCDEFNNYLFLAHKASDAKRAHTAYTRYDAYGTSADYSVQQQMQMHAPDRALNLRQNFPPAAVPMPQPQYPTGQRATPFNNDNQYQTVPRQPYDSMHYLPQPQQLSQELNQHGQPVRVPQYGAPNPAQQPHQSQQPQQQANYLQQPQYPAEINQQQQPQMQQPWTQYMQSQQQQPQAVSGVPFPGQMQHQDQQIGVDVQQPTGPMSQPQQAYTPHMPGH